MSEREGMRQGEPKEEERKSQIGRGGVKEKGEAPQGWRRRCKRRVRGGVGAGGGGGVQGK